MLYCASYYLNVLFLRFNIKLGNIHSELKLHLLYEEIDLVERLPTEVSELHELST